MFHRYNTVFNSLTELNPVPVLSSSLSLQSRLGWACSVMRAGCLAHWHGECIFFWMPNFTACLWSYLRLIVCPGMCVDLCFHVLVCQRDRVPICSCMRAPLWLWAIVSAHVCWLQSISESLTPVFRESHPLYATLHSQCSTLTFTPFPPHPPLHFLS